MAKIQEKIPEKEKKAEPFNENEVEIIEPNTSILDAYVKTKDKEYETNDSNEPIKIDDTTTLFTQKYSQFVISPILKYLDNALENSNIFTKLTEKQQLNLRKDFDIMIQSLGSNNPIAKIINKISGKAKYIPFILDILGITTQKGFEYRNYKKGL